MTFVGKQTKIAHVARVCGFAIYLTTNPRKVLVWMVNDGCLIDYAFF